MVEVNGALWMVILLTPPGSNKSVIDITITSANLALLWNHYWIGHLWQWSLPYQYNIGGFSCLRYVFLYKLIFDTDKANKLHHYLLSTSEEFFSKVPMDSTEIYEYFADHLRSLTRLLFPEKQLPRSVPVLNNRKSPPWMKKAPRPF